MISKKIYIDIDDVLCQTAGALAQIVNEHFGKNFTYDDVKHFNLRHSFNLTSDEFAHMFNVFHEDKNLLNFEPIEDAIESVKQLYSAGCDIAVVTGRPPATRQQSKKWLEKHGFPFHHLYFVDKYSRYVQFEHDAETLSLDDLTKLSFDFAVEDNPDMALFVSEKMKTKVLLLDCPWNRGLKDSAFVCRCHGWKEVVAKVLENSGQ